MDSTGFYSAVVFLLLGNQHLYSVVSQERDSACHGTHLDCDFMDFVCPSESRIRLLSQFYGVKTTSCVSNKKRCKTSPDGCCRFSEGDCIEPYSSSHALDLFHKCSRGFDCRTVQVHRARCNGEISTYAFVDYECVPDNSFVGFCEERELNSDVINIVFSGHDSANASPPSRCSCTISSVDDVTDHVVMSAVDIRLTTELNTSGRGSSCSSASVNSSDGVISLACDSSEPDESNFVYNTSFNVILSDKQTTLLLKDLYSHGNSDVPSMVWFSVQADTGQVKVRCGQADITTPPTTEATTAQRTTSETPGTTPTGVPTTTDAEKPETESSAAEPNTGVVAGVTVPLVLILLAAAGVLLFCLWRRRLRHADEKRGQSVYNEAVRYTENPTLDRRSHGNHQYDDIGDVPEVFDGTPHYDDVYEKNIQKRDSEDRHHTLKLANSINGHTYVNCPPNVKHMPHTGQKSVRKSAKTPYGAFKEKRDRILTFFNMRKSKEDGVSASNSQSPDPNRPRGQTADGSNNSANSVRIEILPSESDQNVPTSPVIESDVVAIKTPNVKKQPPSPKGVKAVVLPDQYIEFQFGALDGESKDLFASQSTGTVSGPSEQSTTRPTMPNRPPPKPAHISGRPISNESSSKVPLTVNKDCSSTEQSDIEQMLYDYADVDDQENPDISSALTSSKQNVTAGLTEDTMYDYADDEDGDDNRAVYDFAEDLYEEVDGKRVKSVKHKNYISTGDLPDNFHGYEKPFTGHIRPTSSPATPHYLESMPVAPPVPSQTAQSVENLGTKTALKPQAKPKSKSPVVYELQKALAPKIQGNVALKPPNVVTDAGKVPRPKSPLRPKYFDRDQKAKVQTTIAQNDVPSKSKIDKKDQQGVDDVANRGVKDMAKLFEGNK